MFETIKLGIALGGSIICGLYDLKTSDMLDALAISMIIAGIGIHAYESYLLSSLEPLLNSLTVGFFFLIFGLFMYYAGYWGGGDGELLVAIGVLLPTGLTGSLSFSLNFFINTFIVGGIYSIIYAFFVAYKNKRIKAEFFKSVKRDKKIIILTTGVTFLSFSLLSYIFGRFIFTIIITSLIFLMFILFRFARVVEKYGFYKKIHVSQLKEGDVIGEDIPKLRIYKKLIRGLTKDEINKIRKIRKYVIIREGVRYGPVFPLALIVTLLGFLPIGIVYFI